MPVTLTGLSNLTNTWRFVRQLCKRILWRLVQVITQVQAERTLIAQGHSCPGGDAVQFCKRVSKFRGTYCLHLQEYLKTATASLSDTLMPCSLTTRRHVPEESNIFTTMSSCGHAVGCRLLTVNVRSWSQGSLYGIVQPMSIVVRPSSWDEQWTHKQLRFTERGLTSPRKRKQIPPVIHPSIRHASLSP
jgi:hypothetical protein